MQLVIVYKKEKAFKIWKEKIKKLINIQKIHNGLQKINKI